MVKAAVFETDDYWFDSGMVYIQVFYFSPPLPACHKPMFYFSLYFSKERIRGN